jgi:hypothetical protein
MLASPEKEKRMYCISEWSKASVFLHANLTLRLISLLRNFKLQALFARLQMALLYSLDIPFEHLGSVPYFIYG